MIQTIKRKLGTEKLDPNFANFKEVLHQIVEDIRKSNHSTLKKSPFELHFGRKPNTEWSQAFHNVVNSDTSAQRLERNLLTPDQIASQDYSRDRAKVVPRGSASPQIAPRFNPMFSLEGNVAESEPYKALADLARAANKWTQYKRNLPPDGGKRVLQELSSRHSDLAHSLKTGLSRKTLCFAEDRSVITPPWSHSSVHRLPTLQSRRQSKTSKLETLLLSDPSRVRVFRKIVDRQSSKPLFKLAKFKITRITDHTYVTDKGKVYQKNHVCLKPNFRNNISATQSTLGDRLQSPGPSSRNGGKKPVTRSFQPNLLKKRPDDTSVSQPVVVDLTIDSSSEGSSGQNTLPVVREYTPVEKRPRIQDNLSPVTFADSSFPLNQSPMDTLASSPRITQSVNPTVANARSEYSSPANVAPEGFVQPAQHVSSDSNSSYPSLSLRAQPILDDSKAVRTSSRSKKAAKFFGDPLRHSVKIVEEDTLLGEEACDLPSQSNFSSSHSPRRPLIRDRPQLVTPEASFSSLINKLKMKIDRLSIKLFKTFAKTLYILYFTTLHFCGIAVLSI